MYRFNKFKVLGFFILIVAIVFFAFLISKKIEQINSLEFDIKTKKQIEVIRKSDKIEGGQKKEPLVSESWNASKFIIVELPNLVQRSGLILNGVVQKSAGRALQKRVAVNLSGNLSQVLDFMFLINKDNNKVNVEGLVYSKNNWEKVGIVRIDLALMDN
jgi:hypothetical protein